MDLLFKKVFNNKVIRNVIFSHLKSMSIKFKTIQEYHIKNRIGLKRIRSLGWYLKRNEISLLKDRLHHSKVQDDYLLIKSNCINKLMEINKTDIELMKLVYTTKKEQMDNYDLIYYAALNNNLMALELFTNVYPTNTTDQSIDIAIYNCNTDAVKWLYENRKEGYSIYSIYQQLNRPPSNYLKCKIFHSSNDQYELYIYLFEISTPPQMSLDTYIYIKSQKLREHVLANGIVDINLLELDNICLVKFNKSRSYSTLSITDLNDDLSCVTNGLIYLIRNYVDQDIFYQEDLCYTNIKIMLLWCLFWYDYEKIDCVIEKYGSKFPMSKFKSIISNSYINYNRFSIFKQPIIKERPWYYLQQLSHVFERFKTNPVGTDKDFNVARQFQHLKTIIKYQSSSLNDTFHKWWEMDEIKFELFSIEQITELINMVIENSLLNYKDQRECQEFIGFNLKNLFIQLIIYKCNCLESFSNVVSLLKWFNSYEVCKLQLLFENCKFSPIDDLQSFKVLVELSNENENVNKIFFGNCKLFKQEKEEAEQVNGNCNCDDGQITEFVELVIQLGFFNLNCNFDISGQLIKDLIDLLYNSTNMDENFIKSISKIKENYIYGNEVKETLSTKRLNIWKTLLCDMLVDQYHFNNLKFIQIIVENFSQDLNHEVATNILGLHYQGGDTVNGSPRMVQLLFEKVVLFCKVKPSNISSKWNTISLCNYYSLMELFGKEFKNEILTFKIDYQLLSKQLLSWYLKNCPEIIDDSQVPCYVKDDMVVQEEEKEETIQGKKKEDNEIILEEDEIIQIEDQTMHCLQIIQEYIENKKLLDLIESGEFKQSISIYSKYKELFKKGDFRIRLCKLKTICKYQDLPIIIGILKMIGKKNIKMFVWNQLLKRSLLNNRVDLYEYLLEKSPYVGYLTKLTSTEFFYPFLRRNDLPMFKFVLDQYLNHHRTIIKHSDEHIHNLIFNLYCESLGDNDCCLVDYSFADYFNQSKFNCDIIKNTNRKSISISNYLQSTFPQFTNSKPLIRVTPIDEENEILDGDSNEIEYTDSLDDHNEFFLYFNDSHGCEKYYQTYNYDVNDDDGVIDSDVD